MSPSAADAAGSLRCGMFPQGRSGRGTASVSAGRSSDFSGSSSSGDMRQKAIGYFVCRALFLQPGRLRSDPCGLLFESGPASFPGKGLRRKVRTFPVARGSGSAVPESMDLPDKKTARPEGRSGDLIAMVFSFVRLSTPAAQPAYRCGRQAPCRACRARTCCLRPRRRPRSFRGPTPPPRPARR